MGKRGDVSRSSKRRDSGVVETLKSERSRGCRGERRRVPDPGTAQGHLKQATAGENWRWRKSVHIGLRGEKQEDGDNANNNNNNKGIEASSDECFGCM